MASSCEHTRLIVMPLFYEVLLFLGSMSVAVANWFLGHQKLRHAQSLSITAWPPTNRQHLNDTAMRTIQCFELFVHGGIMVSNIWLVCSIHVFLQQSSVHIVHSWAGNALSYQSIHRPHCYSLDKLQIYLQLPNDQSNCCPIFHHYKCTCSLQPCKVAKVRKLLTSAYLFAFICGNIWQYNNHRCSAQLTKSIALLRATI